MKKFALALLATLALYAAHELPTVAQLQRKAVLAHQPQITQSHPRADAAFDEIGASLH